MPPKTWFPEKHALRPRKYCIVHGAALVSTWIEKCRHERGRLKGISCIPQILHLTWCRIRHHVHGKMPS